MSQRIEHVAFGRRIYRVVRPFADFRGLPVATLSKCAVDSRGNLYISQRSDPPVLVFDRAGKFVRSIGEGIAADSHGIRITADDRVWLVDRDGHQVFCFAPDGKRLVTIGDSARPRYQAPFSHPTDVAVGADGDVYVADGYGNTMVHRFSPDGKLKKSWGGLGAGPGQFTTPHGIAFSSDGRLLVGDRENNRVQIFTPDGAYLGEWHGFFHPMEIHVGDGLVYVTDQRPRVTALTESGEVVGSCKPALAMPHGMTGDAEGNLYIVETRSPTVTQLVPVA